MSPQDLIEDGLQFVSEEGVQVATATKTQRRKYICVERNRL